MNKRPMNGTHTYYIGGSGTYTDKQLYEMAMAEFNDDFFFQIRNHKHYKKLSDIKHDVFVSRSIRPQTSDYDIENDVSLYKLEVRVYDPYSWGWQWQLRAHIEDWCNSHWKTPVLGVFARYLFRRL